MKVLIVDRAAQNWGAGWDGVMSRSLRTVEIADTCAKCGGPRGEPERRRFCEDGDWYDVDVWHNACGHVDKYSDVLAEQDT